MEKKTDKLCVLRILTGVAAGAEVELRSGLQYQLGRSDEMDLIIDDPALDGEHARIVVEGLSVRLTPVDDALVQLHGERFEGGIVPLYVALQLGDTLVAFGDGQRNWSTVRMPEGASLPPAVRPQESQTETGVEQATAEPKVSGTASKVVRRVLAGILALAALIVVVLPTAVGSWRLIQMRQQAAEVLADQESPIIALGKEIQFILAPAKPQDRVPSWTPQWAALHLNRSGKTWAITGYLNSITELQALQAAIQGKPVLVRVKVREVLERNLKQVVASQKLDVGVEYIGDGRFAVTGKVHKGQVWAQHWKSLVEQTRTDVPGIVDLIDRTTRTPSNAVDSESTPSQPSVKPGVVVEKTKEQTPEPIVIPIKSVSVGRSGCLTLANGERLFVGAQLPGGFRIDEIAVKQIVASRDGEQFILKLNSGL